MSLMVNLLGAGYVLEDNVKGSAVHPGFGNLLHLASEKKMQEFSAERDGLFHLHKVVLDKTERSHFHFDLSEMFFCNTYLIIF